MFLQCLVLDPQCDMSHAKRQIVEQNSFQVFDDYMSLGIPCYEAIVFTVSVLFSNQYCWLLIGTNILVRVSEQPKRTFTPLFWRLKPSLAPGAVCSASKSYGSLSH